MDLYKIGAIQNGLIMVALNKKCVPSWILGAPLSSCDYMIPNFISF